MSSRPLLEAAFWLFGSATTVFALYSGGGIVVPFLLAPGRLRLRVAKARPSASTRDLAGRGDAGDGGPARTGARPFATASEIAGSGVARDGGPTSTGVGAFAPQKTAGFAGPALEKLLKALENDAVASEKA